MWLKSENGRKLYKRNESKEDDEKEEREVEEDKGKSMNVLMHRAFHHVFCGDLREPFLLLQSCRTIKFSSS